MAEAGLMAYQDLVRAEAVSVRAAPRRVVIHIPFVV